MKIRTPRWWYERRGRRLSATLILLTPVAWIWSAVTAQRIARAHPVDPGVPVICVGNLTMGGSGKTPVVREILRRLTAQGINAHGLSRGHGGMIEGPAFVDPGLHTAADVGDEALMLAQDFPFWIARARVQGAQAAAEDGAAVVVMDDGFQNPSLKKTLSILVVDGETRDGEWPFGDGAVFPAGPLREPLAAGLDRADAVVILAPADLPAVDPEMLALFSGKTVLIARLEPVEPPPAGPQIGFAGVGKPWKVERALQAAGCDLVDFLPLPDHAHLDLNGLRLLAQRAELSGAGLITTEKDWVKLPADWRERVVAFLVRARFEDEAGLDRLLARAISSRNEPAA
jgi:tetraacyldisaccharide 4'-kinase